METYLEYYEINQTPSIKQLVVQKITIILSFSVAPHLLLISILAGIDHGYFVVFASALLATGYALLVYWSAEIKQGDAVGSFTTVVNPLNLFSSTTVEKENMQFKKGLYESFIAMLIISSGFVALVEGTIFYIAALF